MGSHGDVESEGERHSPEKAGRGRLAFPAFQRREGLGLIFRRAKRGRPFLDLCRFLEQLGTIGIEPAGALFVAQESPDKRGLKTAAARAAEPLHDRLSLLTRRTTHDSFLPF
jgi:hypothetical protein